MTQAPHGPSCTQPGCSGTVLDGYCDVCGMAPADGAGQASPAPAAPAASEAPTGAVSAAGGCAQPGCAGSIVDGYCDVCGSPGQGGGTSAVAPVSTATTPRPRPSTMPAASGPPAADGSACRQPGCTGSYLDGYCDVCGSPADTAPDVAGEDQPLAGGGDSVATSASKVASAAIGSKRAGSATTRRTRSGSQRMRSARLGAGLTHVPPAPEVDPAKAIVENASVPENKRNCAKCGTKVGRGRDGQPGRSEGFCPQCGQEFSFTPKLVAGDVVGGQYEVAGALAHGGLGWIYLARDRNVSNRWVVLKGLLNSGDADALAAAIAEQQFLAQVEHPLIVEIYNFVTHEGAGYIVMEYVGGKSLKQILKERMRANGGSYDPLPVDQALAYIVELLPAFQYLHDLGLVYCDFKPDNMIQVGDAMKLIDLGGVRQIDDDESAIFGTVGYQAPEVAEVGTSVASDIYTIGRTLVVLCMEFRGYQGTYLHTLPPPETTPLFADNDSLYWMLAKCCAPDPADRFASADELRTQMLGVLREVVAEKREGTSLTSAASVLFESPSTSRAVAEWTQLPGLREDTTDSQHAWLASIGDDNPVQRLKDLEQAPERTAEVLLALADTALRADQAKLAAQYSAELLQADPWEWRALWIDGLAAMSLGNWESAKASFNAVYQQAPGELAPKLALAVACEMGGLPDVAEGLYAVCARTDATYVAPASFGVARIRAQRGDSQGAVKALDQVPTTSRGYVDSRRLRADVLLGGGSQEIATLDQAMRTVDSVSLDPGTKNRYVVEILGRALERTTVAGAPPVPKGAKVGSYPADEESLRNGIERAYRSLAREASTLDERVILVDQANAVRMWSLT